MILLIVGKYISFVQFLMLTVNEKIFQQRNFPIFVEGAYYIPSSITDMKHTMCIQHPSFIFDFPLYILQTPHTVAHSFIQS